jgi:hypothetical protein
VRPVSSLGVGPIAAVTAGGVALIGLITYVRFCGEISVPAKPAKPRFDERPEVVAKHRDESDEGYRQAIEADAQHAGIKAPSIADMSRAHAWREDSQRYVIKPGDAAIDTKAGLRLTAIVTRLEGSEELLGLQIENTGASAVAYDVDTKVSSGIGACVNRTLIPHNGNVIAAGAKEIRSECVWKRGMELYVTHTEATDVSALEAYYLSLVPPQALGVDDRIAQGHRPQLPAGDAVCNVSMAQSTLRAIEDGRTKWRDLADYYARHSCGTYQFVDGYQAFTKDGEKRLPVTE